MKKPLSASQIVCITALWLLLLGMVIFRAKRIDGVTVITLVISACLVFIPVYKSIRKRK